MREWTTFGRYVLLDKIGTGGMAEIFRAKTFGAAGFEKEFAIKLILPSLVDDTEFVEMFINEAKIAVSLYHANVVQVFDLGELDGQYFIAMEYVHGKDLLDVLARCAELDIKIPLEVVLFISMEMLKGLDFAHRAKNSFGEALGIIHRDISPSNILISYAGDVKVGDFGVAKAAIQRNLTESGTLKGKVGYMSPEQVMGESIDARSDIFSAGIVFFEALSMSRLFIGGSDLDVMLKVRDADISTSMERAGPMPTGLREIVEQALARHREERYQSAGGFYQSIVDFCYDHNIRSSGSELSNFMRRLFAEEIEEEKERRRNDPHAPGLSVVVPPRPRRLNDSIEIPHYISPSSAAEEHAPSTSGLSMLETDESPPTPKPAPEAPADERGNARYRYQSNGLVYGPMTKVTFMGLLRSRPPGEDDCYSLDGDSWQPLREARELRELLDEIGFPQAVEGRRQASVLPPPEVSLEGIAVQRSTAIDDAEPSNKVPLAGTIDRVRKDQQRVVEEMRQAYTQYEGSFHDVSFPRLLARLHHIKGTGRLFVEMNGIEKSIYVQSGEIILVESNKAEELLGAFLLSREIISNDQLQEGLARLSEWGGRLGDALVAIGAIPAHDVFQLLSDQMREKLLEVFTWTEGRYGYFENQEPNMHGYPLDVNCYRTIVTGCREYVSFDYLLRYYRDRMNISLFLRSPAPFELDALRLRGNELRVAKQIESGMSLNGLLRRFPPSTRELVFRTVYLLHQCELVTFEMTTETVNFPG